MSRPRIPPPDHAAHLDNLLVAEIANVNTRLGRYVLHFLDADAGRVAPSSAEDDRALADTVADVAEGLRARAERREQHGDPMPLIDHGTQTQA